MKVLRRASCNLLLSAFLASGMPSGVVKAEEAIIIRKAWAMVDRENPNELEIFLDIENRQLSDDYLLAVEIPQATQVFIHEPLPGKTHTSEAVPALLLPAKSQVTMNSRQLHLVALGIAAPKGDSRLKATAIFRDSEPRIFQVLIYKPTQQPSF